MDKILGIRFRKTGKLYYANPLKYIFKVGDLVIVESERGIEIARVVSINDKVELLKKNPKLEIQNIIRPASKEDIKQEMQNKTNAASALEKCKKIAKRLNLEMKLIHAEYVLDTTKLIFYFVAEERVDFRELVKELAAEYRARIEIRQVGPRDEIKAYSNVGMCGRETCCTTFLPDFESVTIKMAKEQGLQINMNKISGNCGRLMCCLKYEEETYKEKMKQLPKINEIVKYQGETAKVVGLDILQGNIKLKIGPQGEERFEIVANTQITREIKK